jgi:hypothetical protein
LTRQTGCEKPVWPVIPMSRRQRGISHCPENAQGEIPRFALDRPLQGFARNDDVHQIFCRPKKVANEFC